MSDQASGLSPLRQGRITSSRIAAIVGLNPYKGPHGVWRELMGEDTFKGNRATRRGQYLEPVLFDMAIDDLGGGFRWEKAPFRIHPEHDCLGDSCDALIYDGDALAFIGEAKTCGGRVASKYGEPETDNVPVEVWVQSQWHLAHWTEVDTCLVPVLMGGNNFDNVMYRVTRDVGVTSKLVAKAIHFYEAYVKTGVAPEPDGTSETTEYLRGAYSNSNGEIIDVSPQIAHAARERARINAEIKALQTQKNALTNQIVEFVGENQAAKGLGVKVSRKFIEGKTREVTTKGYWRTNITVTED